MKKAICVLLAVLFAAALVGCAQNKSAFTADNEIFTYQKIDEEKTQITVSRTGNIDVIELCEAFEAANPDVQVIYLDITGGNDKYKPLVEWIIGGDAPDIVMSAANFFDQNLTTQYFECLSANPILQNYEAEALARNAVDNDIYSLPGPSNISAMMYNKTLFKQYGWEVPATFDEFVALCDQIKEDTNGEVEPWNPNAKYDQELKTALEAFAYEEVFGGADNRAWYNDYVEGNADFEGHMEPYFEVIQTLADHGILREEHFSYSATARGKEFDEGKIAMINMNIYEADNEQFDFGYMPFPTTKGDLGYICDSYSCFVGVPVKEHTDAQNDAMNRFIEFFSSPEGQETYIGETLKVSNVKNIPLKGSDDIAALQPAIDAGNMFDVLNFENEAGEKADMGMELYQCALAITTGAMSAEECVAAADAPAEAAEENEETVSQTIASAPEDMTILETSFYMADMYREKAGADIGIINHGVAYRGNLVRLFAGDIYSSYMNPIKPRSFDNDSTLIKVSMTGKQIIDALNNPVGNDCVSDSIYAFSGLKCKVAPWNALGEKYLSVKLADGTELEEDKLYTVAIWAGTVAEEYIGETLESYEGTWEELMEAKMSADGTISPADDGRIKLVWD